MANPTPTPKRIPKGTRVRWRARYESDPVHKGEVLAFVDRSAPWPRCADRSYRNDGPAVYVVRCRPVGKPPKLIYPLACRLEAQNPDKVEG